MASWVDVTDRIIPAIGKHIVAEDALAGACESISIDESTDLGVVISALEIVEPRLSVVELATRAKMQLLLASKTSPIQHPTKPWNPKIPWLFNYADVASITGE